MSQEWPDTGKKHRVTLMDLDLDRKEDVSVKTLMTTEQKGCLPCSGCVCSLCSQYATKSLPVARSDRCAWGPHLTRQFPRRLKPGGAHP